MSGAGCIKKAESDQNKADWNKKVVREMLTVQIKQPFRTCQDGWQPLEKQTMKIRSIVTLALLLSGGIYMNSQAEAATAEDRLHIIDAITSISAGADRHDWERVRAAMADEITTDYTGLWGGEPVTQAADELIAGWAGFLPGFEVTQHLVTGHTIDFTGDQTASAQADFQATHRIGDEFWVLGGRYEYSLIKKNEQWLVTSMTMIPTWETGDRALTAQAGERAKALQNKSARVTLQNTPELRGVVHRQVSFDSNGVTLRGILYVPEKGAGPLPGVVVTGAWTTVKEQMAGTYARELAAQGFAALAFDFTGWGESGGEIRFKEDPATKTADIVAAAKFMVTLPEVDKTNISGVGICASSGYMAAAVADSPELKKLALVAAWLHTPEMAEQIYGGAESAAKLIQTSRAADQSETQQLLVAASASDSSSLMYQAPYYTEADRGLIAAYDNKFNLSSWEPWLTYDAQESADRLTKPTMMINSEAAALPAGAHAFAKRTQAPVTEIWLEDVNQFDFYDREDVVEHSTDAIAEFFKQ